MSDLAERAAQARQILQSYMRGGTLDLDAMVFDILRLQERVGELTKTDDESGPNVPPPSRIILC